MEDQRRGRRKREKLCLFLSLFLALTLSPSLSLTLFLSPCFSLSLSVSMYVSLWLHSKQIHLTFFPWPILMNGTTSDKMCLVATAFSEIVSICVLFAFIGIDTALLEVLMWFYCEYLLFGTVSLLSVRVLFTNNKTQIWVCLASNISISDSLNSKSEAT